MTRSLDLITDDVRHDPGANRAFLECLTSRNDPERALQMFGAHEFGHKIDPGMY